MSTWTSTCRRRKAGKVKVGADARIVLDAYPNIAIPAKVSFVASQAQFTPKTVETQTERDKLMFRIRVRIDQERLLAHGDAVRSGLPGVAYVLGSDSRLAAIAAGRRHDRCGRWSRSSGFSQR